MRYNGFEHDHCAGFNLVAVSIMLVAASFILVSVLPGKDAGDVNAKRAATIQKMQTIENATVAFMAANGRRPCPADGQYDINDASGNFGKEAANPGTCTGGTPAAPMGPENAGAGYVVSGVVPTRTLGLDDSYAFDAWGRRITYVVDKRATLKSTCLPVEGLSFNGLGGIKIEPTNGSSTITDYTMAAYISHGPSGYGAFPAQGSTVAGRINTGSADTDKQTNAGVDALGASSTFTYNTTNFTNVRVMKDPTSTFDDVVWYSPTYKNTCCTGTNQCIDYGYIFNGGGNTGISVAAGDINGDGIADLIISNGGGTYVLFGTRTGFPTDPFTYSNLNGTNGFSINGGTDNGGRGLWVADVDGDGYQDLIMGLRNANSSAGYTYVMYGGPTRKSGTAWGASVAANPATNGTVMNGTDGFVLMGATAGDQAGRGVGASDIDGDGRADVMVGAPNATSGGGANGGYAYTVMGKSAVLQATTISTTSGLTTATLGSYTGIFLGQKIYTDNVASGTVIESCGGSNACSSTSITMSAKGSSTAAGVYAVMAGPNVTLTATTITTTNGSASATLGSITGTVGQAVYSTYVPSGTVITNCGPTTPGATCTTASVTLSANATGGAPTTKNAWLGGQLQTPVTTITTYGNNTATVGSIYGLRVGQIIYSSPYVKLGTTISTCGAVTPSTACTSPNITMSAWATGSGTKTMTVASQPLDTTYVDGTNAVRFDGVSAGDQAGEAVTGGDINNDGHNDIIIGAPYANTTGSTGGGANAGYVYVVAGKATPILPSTTITSTDVTSGSTTVVTVASYTGLMVGQMINSPDFPVGTTITACGASPACNSTSITLSNTAIATDSSGTTAFTVAATPLNAAYFTGSNGFRFDGATSNGAGYSLAVGDVNGDGISDLLIGAYNASYAGSQGGSIYVVFGGTTRKGGTAWAATQSLSTSATTPVINGTDGFRLDGIGGAVFTGTSVAVGDFNDDGYGDILTGATNGSPAYGIVVFGKASGWSATQSMTTGSSGFLNGTNGLQFKSNSHDCTGLSVAAGDVNGDGIPDIVIGSYCASPNGFTSVILGRKTTGTTFTWPYSFSLQSL